MADAVPTRDQVRVWLPTVLSPIVRGLGMESDRLARRDWTFRSHDRDLELLIEIEQMVARIYHPNLKQFYRFFTETRTTAVAHDLSLATLREACRRTFGALVASTAMQEL